MKHRRWPYITSVLIVVNVLFFLMTHERLRREANQYAEIESRTLSLAAVHPKAPMTAAQQDLIDSFRNQHTKDWELMASLHDASADLDEMPDEFKELAQELDDFQRDSITARFAVYPPHRSLLSTLTANFLHRSWAQLVFNICFLWLVGGTLEDVWGRSIYSCIWLVSGILGVWSYTLAYRAGLAPLVGASCLIAVLMGFYVIRFPKTAIERGTAIWVVRPHFLRFSSPVYTIFPMWIMDSFFWESRRKKPVLKASWRWVSLLP